jgi:hypothetical protein
MELKEFVSESLKQIIDGVIDAQTYVGNKGASINPGHIIYINPSNIPFVDYVRCQSNNPVQIMEFDVAVTVT